MGKLIPTFSYEIELTADGQIVIAGVDEVGRGALAGPIVAAAVVFENYQKLRPKLRGIRDSKTLIPKQREEFDKIIKSLAKDFAFGQAEPHEIDKHGIGGANVLAFKRALDNLKNCDFVLIDGRRFRGFDYKYRTIIKGESRSISIAAASIIAKVYRDSLMACLHKEFEIYNFAKNFGYGTKRHIKTIKKYGPSSHHRKSFLKKISSQNHDLFVEK